MSGHEISEASLFSYLVTRQTGRAVRLSIESQIAGCGERVVGILDFQDVAVIDFSCADEVVAKLVNGSQEEPVERLFLFRGLQDHHLDPIESALRRRSLAVAAERANGHRLLVGSVDDAQRRVWEEVDRRGRAAVTEVARSLNLPEPRVREILEILCRRRLVVAEESRYVSLHRMIREARRSSRDG